MKNSVFDKLMENTRNDSNIKLVRTNKGRNQLASDFSYNSTKYFLEDLSDV